MKTDNNLYKTFLELLNIENCKGRKGELLY